MYQIYFFSKLLYSNSIFAIEQDYRANPELGLQNRIIRILIILMFMVVCADERAAAAAKKILNSGGNAIDAAIATQNVLSVVASIIWPGGGGFAYYNKEKNIIEAWMKRICSG